MMLLITDEEYEKSKISNLLEDLDVNDIKITTDLEKAKSLILDHNHNNVNLIIITSAVIDDIKYDLEQIKSISDILSGPIIVKVKNDLIGMNLMKEHLINDFYVATKDKTLEFERLKRAFRVARLRSRVSNTISEIRKNLAELEKINKV